MGTPGTSRCLKLATEPSRNTASGRFDAPRAQLTGAKDHQHSRTQLLVDRFSQPGRPAAANKRSGAQTFVVTALDSMWTLFELVMEPGDLESVRSAYDVVDDMIRRLHASPQGDWAGWPYPPFPTPWLEHWTGQTFRARTEILRRVGAPNPDDSADDELTQNESELAGWRFAAAVRSSIQSLISSELRTAAVELIPVTMEKLLESVVTKAAMEIVELITDPSPELFEDPSTEPRWTLAEISPDGQFTGRILAALAEKLASSTLRGRTQ